MLYICKYAASKGGQQHLCCILNHVHDVEIKTVLHLYAAIRLTSSHQFFGHLIYS